MSESWYVLHNGRALGPHTLDSLRGAAASGTLSDAAKVRQGDDGEWLFAAEVPGLFPRGAIARTAASRGQMVCTQCGTLARPVSHTQGSLLIEIVLWLAFLVPGLIYTAWRITTRGRACPSCRSRQLVAPDSPVGRRLLSELQSR